MKQQEHDERERQQANYNDLPRFNALVKEVRSKQHHHNDKNDDSKGDKQTE